MTGVALLVRFYLKFGCLTKTIIELQDCPTKNLKTRRPSNAYNS
nr:MAG TPA: hypothetical protein [Caudoviricetes sp.]